MRWTSCTMARHDSVAMGNALRRKSIEKCSFSRLKPRIFACGARAAGCAGESAFLHHARVNRPMSRVDSSITPRHPGDVKELDELSTFAGSLVFQHHLEQPPSPCQRTKSLKPAAWSPSRSKGLVRRFRMVLGQIGSK